MSRKNLPEYNKKDSVHAGSEFTDEEREFIKAIDKYRNEHHKIWLSYTEILSIAKAIGYKKVGNESI